MSNQNGKVMKTAGIAIDSWKLDIFRKHLAVAGYQFTEEPLTEKTLLLKVRTSNVKTLSVVVREANEEAANAQSHNR